MYYTGAILAGGRSTRMKFNKAFARIAGETVLDIIIDKFKDCFAETIIITNDPEQYRSYNIKTFTDIYPRLGPISGIHAALHYSQQEEVFVQGCDMPFLEMKLIEYMLGRLKNHHAVVPVIKGCLQPTSAVYRRDCLPVLQSCLENNKLKLTRIFEELDTVYLTEKEIHLFGDPERIFYNINDREALKKAEKMRRD